MKKPRSFEAFEGDTVIIYCEVIGDPKPDVVWLRDFLKVNIHCYYTLRLNHRLRHGWLLDVTRCLFILIVTPLFKMKRNAQQYQLDLVFMKSDPFLTFNLV